MDIGKIVSTGAVLLIGVIALKAFGGIQGVTDIFKGFGDLLSPDTPPPFIPPYEPPPDMPPEYVPDVMPISPPTLPELIFPPLVLLPDAPPQIPPPIKPPSAPSLIFPPLGFIDLLFPSDVDPLPDIFPPTESLHGEINPVETEQGESIIRYGGR